jgi:nucleoside-diphosphate-sugar epimerase
VSFDPRKARQTYDFNVGATKAVLGAARALGIGNLLYVSSVAALFHPGAPRVDESTPLAELSEPYSRSKRDSEAYVRGLQQQGVPVQISYPVAVIGPDDPKLSAANRALATFVGQMLSRSTTGFQCVDVRDLAQSHAWLLEHPPTRACEERATSSVAISIRGELRQCLEALGRASSVHASHRIWDACDGRDCRSGQKLPFGRRSPPSPWPSTQWPPADSSRFMAKSGLCFRSGEETFGDTISGWPRPVIFHAGRRAGSFLPTRHRLSRHGTAEEFSLPCRTRSA